MLTKSCWVETSSSRCYGQYDQNSCEWNRDLLYELHSHKLEEIEKRANFRIEVKWQDGFMISYTAGQLIIKNISVIQNHRQYAKF